MSATRKPVNHDRSSVVNVTTVDIAGSPTSWQVWGGGVSVALEQLEERIAEGVREAARSGAHEAWRKPIVAAFLFDTDSRKLYQYTVDGMRAKIVEGGAR